MTLYQIMQATWQPRNTQEAQREWECYKLQIGTQSQDILTAPFTQREAL